MEQILIRKEHDQGYAFYAFKPKGYVDDFYKRTGGMASIGFDRSRGRWTAPAREESLAYLYANFGKDCLFWEGGGPDIGKNKAGANSSGPIRQRQAPRPEGAGPKAKRAVVKLPEHWRLALHRTEEQLKVRRYSWHTVKAYLYHLKHFFEAHPKGRERNKVRFLSVLFCPHRT